MAAHVSPGVYWREIDLSNYIPSLSSTQVGIVTTATKGPINDKTLITTKEQLVKQFGYPALPNYGLYAAMLYLDDGNQCWVTRVESSTFPSLTAIAPAKDITGADLPVPALTPGSYYNGIVFKVAYANPVRFEISISGSEAIGDVGGPWTLAIDVLKEILEPGTVKVYVGSNAVALDDEHGVLVPAATGNGFAGTVNYETGAVVLTTAQTIETETVTVRGLYNTQFTLSTFKTVQGESYLMEEFKGLNLDPRSDRYYKNIIKRSFTFGDFETDVFPREGLYTFSGGTDGIDAIDAGDYIGIYIGNQKTGLQIFNNPDEIDINAVCVPGVSSDPVVQELISLAETRKDCVAIIDPPLGFTPEDVSDWANGINAFSDRNAVDSSYAALYYPWIKSYDAYNDQEVYLPPSGWAIWSFAKIDNNYDLWWAPAGYNIGTLKHVIGMERSLTQGERDFLYQNRVNPIGSIHHSGALIYGQKTTQVYPSALDRINVRRLLIYIEKVVTTAMQPFVFRPNHPTTWHRVEILIQAYLDGLVNQGALYEGKAVCDGNINTPEVINRSEMLVNIFLKPTKMAEIITLNFIIVETGANINELVGKQFPV